MKISKVFLLLLFHSMGYAQKKTILFTPGGNQNGNTVIEFSPIALIDPVMPTVQAGVECKLSDAITWYNEIGIKYIRGITEQHVDTNFLPSTGFKIKTEFRYFFEINKNFERSGKYLAANIFFVRNVYNRSVLYAKDASDSVFKTDNFGVRKNVFGFNLLYGYEGSLSKKIFFNSYIGLGFRIRQVGTVNKEYKKNADFIQEAIDLNIYTISDKTDTEDGFSVAPNLTAGIRLCYRL